jgi:hypothetical protein
MTLPDRGPRRQPGRIGLYGPFLLLLLFAIGWSGAWLWLRANVEQGLDESRAGLARAGYELAWRELAVSGYPFRLDVDVRGATLRAPSGWRLDAPLIKSETTVLAPGHFVFEVPGDLALTRRNGDVVSLRFKLLHASLSRADAHPPRISVESITAPPKANPLFFTTADEIHLHSRAGPDAQGAFYLEVDGANASLPGLLGRIAEEKPVTLIAEGIVSHADDLSLLDWRASVERWRRDGGSLDLRSLKLLAGSALLDARPGRLTVDADGALNGSLTVTLREAPRALAAMARTGLIAPQAAVAAGTVIGAARQGPEAVVTLDFQAGQTTLGPAAIAPAPKVY